MSAPTRELQRLSIGGTMPTMTRSQAQQERRRRERVERQRLSEQREGSPILLPGADGTIRGHTGITYNVRQLTPRSQKVAVRGLHAAEFMVDASREFSAMAESSYYGFQLRVAESVRVYGPSGSNPRITCTCDDFNRNPGTAFCAHIYWLYDGLNAVLAKVPLDSTQMVDKESVESRFTELYEQIGQSINHLTDKLNQTWTWDDDTEDIDEIVQDMLSVLVPRRFYDDFNEDFYSRLPEAEPGNFHDLVVRGDPLLTIFGLARRDPILRDRLRNAIDEKTCGDDFLIKLGDKSTSILERYDMYARDGPRFDDRFVDRSGVALRQIIDKVSAYRESDRAPTSSNFNAKAAELVLNILEEVCMRNKDIYEDSTWQTTEDDPEADRDCNIFANLIGSPPVGFRDTHFVLDFLADELPPDAWRHLLGRLDSLVEKLREHEVPAPYLQKLTDLTSRYHAGGGVYEELEEYEYHLGPAMPGDMPDSPADQWRHTAPHGVASSSGTTRRPTLSDQPEPQRRRLG